LSQQSLNEILLCTTTVDQAIAAGRVKVDGNRARLDEPLTLLDTFDPLFNIVTL
jgi:alkyl sulfatase BDS1-like metallo-beta-lactamase superfamily hydrolase